jgi:hypothetical protein
VLEGLLILGVLSGLGGMIVMAGVVVAGVGVVARGVHRGDGEEERDDQRAQGSSRKEKGRHFVLILEYFESDEGCGRES